MTTFNVSPVLTGDRIHLRMAEESDLDAYHEYLSDPELDRLTGSQQTFSKEAALKWLQRIAVRAEDRIDLMIIPHGTNRLVGEVVLNEMDPINRSANIRIGIYGTENRSRGYGSEAMKLMLRHGFEVLKLHRIELGVYPFNPRAIHVYEKLGFVREGVQRDVLFYDGAYHDCIMMSILEDDFRKLTESK